SSSADNLEILFTPINGGSVNSDSDDIGVDGQFIDITNPDKGIRLDFGDFTYDANGGGTSDDAFVMNNHMTVNGFKFTIDQISNGTTADVRLKAFNADEDGGVEEQAPNPAGDVTLTITMVKIFNAAGVLIGTATGDTSFGGIGVDFEAGGTVLITNLSAQFKVQTYTTSGYDRIEITNAGTTGGGSNDGKFSLSQLQVETTMAGNPVNFGFDLALTDADGDTVTVTNAIQITANPAAPPIAFDLDGDGLEFVDRSAGVAFDYDGDGTATSTAWVASDDGLLAIDANGDGTVNDGSEIVFAHDGLTDLEGLAADYDTNHDGVLDANDADFAKFGVWQDANANGVSDAGEFASLGDLGITSLKLTSDGVSYSAANDDVLVHGETSYTRADGSTGLAGDVSFATGSSARADEASRQAAQNAAAPGLANALVAASLVAASAATLDQSDATHGSNGAQDSGIAVDSTIGDAGADSAKSAPRGDSITASSDTPDSFAPKADAQSDHRSADHHDAQDNGLGIADTGDSDRGMNSLLGDSDTPVQADVSAHPVFVDMAAMPAIVPAAMVQAAAAAAPADLGNVLADALGGGAGQGPDIDALLDAIAPHSGDVAGLLAASGGDVTALAGNWAQAHGFELPMPA
ncbi:MAG: hypothetical protein ACREB5_06305, partial [Sphingomonadaceae bacterium]